MTTVDASTTSYFLATPRSAYIHIPFCSHKCGYCDFASVAGQDALIDRYLDALDAEMSSILTGPTDVDTIFVGGGTPTYVSPTQLDRYLARLTRWFPLRPGVEFTVESNPNTLTAEKVEILARHGVNRVSLGAQSFQRHLLGRLERDHDPDSVGRAVEMLRPYIPRVSIDLIFGVPSQTLPEWQEDLGKALALGVTHLSAYGLTDEKGTPLWKQRRLGIVEPIDEGVEADMYEHLLGAMDSAGWCGYEISNFHAIDTGEPCRHNLAYWANAPYYGFGTGAAAFVDGRRTLNLRPIVNYLETVEAGLSPICQGETLDGPARARETAVLNLRRAQGLDKKEFLGQTGFDIDHLAGASVRPMMDLGLLEDDGRRWRLTRAGFLLADGVLARIV